MAGGGDAVQQALEHSLLQAAQTMENELDTQLHKLENLGEDDLESIRRKRLEEMKRNESRKEEWIARGHGEFQEVQERDFFKEMKGEERLVCLFYRESPPCHVMEKHLRTLCASHLETRFLKIEAEKAPFLAERLRIWMLPTLAIVKNEKITDYIVGLDELGGVEDFDTNVLEARLIQAGVLFERPCHKPSKPAAHQQGLIRKGGSIPMGDSDEDSDFD